MLKLTAFAIGMLLAAAAPAAEASTFDVKKFLKTYDEATALDVAAARAKAGRPDTSTLVAVAIANAQLHKDLEPADFAFFLGLQYNAWKPIRGMSAMGCIRALIGSFPREWDLASIYNLATANGWRVSEEDFLFHGNQVIRLERQVKYSIVFKRPE